MGQYHACGRGMDSRKCHLCLLQPSLCTINTQWHFIVFLSCHKWILLLKVEHAAEYSIWREVHEMQIQLGDGGTFCSLYCNIAQTQCTLTWSEKSLICASQIQIRSPSVTHLETSHKKSTVPKKTGDRPETDGDDYIRVKCSNYKVLWGTRLAALANWS